MPDAGSILKEIRSWSNVPGATSRSSGRGQGHRSVMFAGGVPSTKLKGNLVLYGVNTRLCATAVTHNGLG